jgi:hypothetical protein
LQTLYNPRSAAPIRCKTPFHRSKRQMPKKRLRYLVPLQRHNIHHQTGQIQSIEKKITGQRLAKRNWGRTSQQVLAPYARAGF